MTPTDETLTDEFLDDLAEECSHVPHMGKSGYAKVRALLAPMLAEAERKGMMQPCVCCREEGCVSKEARCRCNQAQPSPAPAPLPESAPPVCDYCFGTGIVNHTTNPPQQAPCPKCQKAPPAPSEARLREALEKVIRVWERNAEEGEEWSAIYEAKSALRLPAPVAAPVEPLAIVGLDAGIRDVVLKLRAAGFHTTDSGDGVSKPCDERTFDGPHVCVTCEPMDASVEARRLKSLLPDWDVEWNCKVGEPLAVIVALCAAPPADPAPQPIPSEPPPNQCAACGKDVTLSGVVYCDACDERGSTWQPIATYDKQKGEPVIVYAHEHGSEFFGYCRWSRFSDGSQGWVGGSFTSRNEGSWTTFLTPSLWMPIKWPAAPSDEETRR
jgi:hypothetical protein